MYYLYEDSLQHSGVKGMHWGVRKYRNYDGTLTAAGKARYGVGDGSSSGGSGKISRREARRQKKVESVRQLSKEAKKATQEAREALEELRRERAKSAEEQKIQNEADQKERIASTRLSNEEMRATIERLKLEREYNELVNPVKKPEPTTMDKLKKFAQDATPIIAAGAAAVKLYQQIKGKDTDDGNKNNNQNNNQNNKQNNAVEKNDNRPSENTGNPKTKKADAASSNPGNTKAKNSDQTTSDSGSSRQKDGTKKDSSSSNLDSFFSKWSSYKASDFSYPSAPTTPAQSDRKSNYQEEYRKKKQKYDAIYRNSYQRTLHDLGWG